MLKIREQAGIFDPEPETSTSSVAIHDVETERQVVEMDKQVNDQRSLVGKLERQYEQIVKLKPEELQQMLRTLDIQDETVVKMVSSLQDALRVMTELSSEGRGERHPSILALRAQAKVFQEQLAEHLKLVQQSHAEKLAFEKQKLSDLEKRFASAQQSQLREKEIESKTKDQRGEYVRAKNHYLQEKAIYQAAKAKLVTESLEAGIGFEPAKIWEKAEPASKPAPFNLRRLWRRVVP